MSTPEDTDDGGGGTDLDELPDEAANAVADRVIDRLQERDDIDLSRIENKAIDISRRQVLGAVAAAGVGGGLIGSTGTAQAAGEDFGNASGTVGTDDQPLEEANVQNLHGESGTFESLNTGDLNSAKQVSQHNTIQAAFDAAGQDGTVVFDPAGGPYVFGSPASAYDGQTIVLQADCDGDGSNVRSFFDLRGNTGVTLVPNGHTLDGQSRSDGVDTGVRTDATTDDCHIEGVLKVRRVRLRGVSIQGTEITVNTVVGDEIGDKSQNAAVGDLVNFGSLEQAEDCEVKSVIGTDAARHTVTFGSKDPQDCRVGYVRSIDPGGAHVVLESADNCTVGTAIGDGARQAINYSSPENTYSTYPEIAILSGPDGDSAENTFERVICRDPVGGTGPCVGFSGNSEGNHVKDLTSINSASNAVEYGTSSGSGENNVVGVRRIEGAEESGVRFNIQSGCQVYGRGKGVIRECQEHGVISVTQDNTTENLHVLANGQDGSTEEGIFFDTDVTGNEVLFCRVEDGGSGSQSVGIEFDASIAGAFRRFVGNDLHDSTTPWGSDFATNSDDATAANTPEP